MKRFLIYHFTSWVGAVLLALVGVVPAARAQTVDWVADMGRGQSAWGINHMVTDAQGNTFVCGSFVDSLVIGAFTLRDVDTTRLGGGDGFVARFDASGTCQWVAHIWGQSSETPGAITLDPTGDVLVTGRFGSYDTHFGAFTLFNTSANSELFVTKLDGTTGQWRWARRMGGTGSDVGTVIETDARGDAYLLGQFYSDTLRIGGTSAYLVNQHAFNNVRPEVLVAKLSGATGLYQWVTRAGVNQATDLKLDGRGHLFVAGSFNYAQADVGATVLNAYSAGSGTSYVVNNQCFVARLNAATGQWQWATQGGDSNRQYGGAYANALHVDGQGIITIVGRIDGSSPITIGANVLDNRSSTYPGINRLMGDGFVARLDSSGQWLNAFRVGEQGDEWLRDIVPTPGAGFSVLGQLSGPSFGLGATNLQSAQAGSFLAHVDPVNGAWQDAAVVGDGGRTSSMNLALDAAGRRYVGGSFFATSFQLGTTTLLAPNNTNGALSGFLARLSAGALAAPGLLPQALTGLEIWPNPTTGTVQVSGPAPGQRVQLVDVQGRRVAEALMPATGPLTLALPAGLASELYVVRVPGTRQARRLVVE